MMDLVALPQGRSMLIWGRMAGKCSQNECGQLQAMLEELALPPGSQIILDFSDTEHIDYRAVPLLIELGRRAEAFQVSIWVAGVSAYLRRILEVGGALDAREFMEKYVGAGMAPPGPVDQAGHRSRIADPGDLMPQGLVVPGLN